MPYQKMNKAVGLSKIILLLLLGMTTGCSTSNIIITDTIKTNQTEPVVYFGTRYSTPKIAKLLSFLEVEDPKKFQLECDKNIAKSCYYYASYNDLIINNRKEAYTFSLYTTKKGKLTKDKA